MLFFVLASTSALTTGLAHRPLHVTCHRPGTGPGRESRCLRLAIRHPRRHPLFTRGRWRRDRGPAAAKKLHGAPGFIPPGGRSPWTTGSGPSCEMLGASDGTILGLLMEGVRVGKSPGGGAAAELVPGRVVYVILGASDFRGKSPGRGPATNSSQERSSWNIGAIRGLVDSNRQRGSQSRRGVADRQTRPGTSWLAGIRAW